ncbi:MAG: tRNA epoxyqueuosine(34) reductase QueG [Bacteroidales bacterium]|jgi:epoxyqueuosine reductase|nr:tRNA epoxyqueuosine(34) reductase QueG [Bacteroidales bacterium]
MNVEIKELALRIGFSDCRIARATPLAEEAVRLSRWLEAGMHGEMGYMARNVEKRIHPELLAECTQTVVSLAVHYLPQIRQRPELPQIAKYAYGADYHTVVKDMLYRLLAAIKERQPHVNGRVFVDSAPVMEHAWAERSGLGWTGKHSLTVHPRYGSYIFLGELFLNTVIEPDQPIVNRCGSCTRCMEACPAKAIVAPRVVDARRCISYLTIEHKGVLDASVQLHNRLFGCDICQDACPWNQKALPVATPTKERSTHPLLEKTADEWLQLTEDEFGALSANSPLQRTGLATIKRNVRQLLLPPLP